MLLNSEAKQRQTFDSCFDKDSQDQPSRVFWRQIEDKAEINKIKLMPVLKQGFLYRSRIEKAKFSHFVLKQGLLYYTSSQESETIIGIAKLGFQKMSTFQAKIDEEDVFGLKISNSWVQVKLYSYQRETILEWQASLVPFLVNRDFIQRFDLQEAIGEGGFSQVFKVVEKKSLKIYAAKVIKHKMIFSDAKGVVLMKQEVEIMRQLDHPNIVKLYEVHEIKNAVILILEYIDGQELRNIHSEFKFTDCLEIVRSLLSVLAYLEKLNIIHRDLKPRNVMITNEPQISARSTKIIDFGLAAFLSEKLLLPRCGTPGYIAPEILSRNRKENDVLSTNVDVFSVGIIFYEMIYKQNPFKTEGKHDSKKLVRRNAAGEINYDIKTMHRKYLSEDVLNFLKKMTAKTKEERPLASVLLANRVFSKRIAKTDHSDTCEEGVTNQLNMTGYTFKVNGNRFKQEQQHAISRFNKPGKFFLESLQPMLPSKGELEAMSPTNLAMLSPINNRRKYRRADDEEEPLFASPTSLNRRGGQKLSDSPLLALDKKSQWMLAKPAPDETSLISAGRGNMRAASSAGKLLASSQQESPIFSKKKNTLHIQSAAKSSLFTLHKCDNIKEPDFS